MLRCTSFLEQVSFSLRLMNCAVFVVIAGVVVLVDKLAEWTHLP